MTRHKVATVKGKSVTFRPSPEHRARLDRLAKATERPVTWLVEKAIASHLPELEKKYARELAELSESSSSPRPSAGGEILGIVKSRYPKRRASVKKLVVILWVVPVALLIASSLLLGWILSPRNPGNAPQVQEVLLNQSNKIATLEARLAWDEAGLSGVLARSRAAFSDDHYNLVSLTAAVERDETNFQIAQGVLSNGLAYLATNIDQQRADTYQALTNTATVLRASIFRDLAKAVEDWENQKATATRGP